MANYGDEDEQGEHSEHDGHTARGFVAGMLFGGLAGAAVTLLLAPQSGLRTRVQLRRKGLDLRDQAYAASQDLTAKAREQADKLQLEAEKMQQRAEHALDVQKERWAPVVEAGKTAVNGS